MTVLAPARARQSFRHEAWFYLDAIDFVSAMVPFITDGLEGGESVMVTARPEQIGWLRDGLSE